LNQSGSERKEIHRFEKNSLEEVRVSLTTYKGREYIDLRVFFQGDDGEMHPGKKGLTIRLDLLPDLETAILKLREALGPQ
jgi:hypothetical protein